MVDNGVLVAIDRSSGSQMIATQARDLAASMNLPLQVVHVLSQSDLDSRREGVPAEGAYLDVIYQDVAREVRADLGDWWGAEAARDADIRILDGDPDEQLLEAVGRAKPGYVVIGVRRRSRVGKLVFGSTAQAILMQAPCPVLAVPTQARSES